MQGFLDLLADSAVPEKLESTEEELGAELTVVAVEKKQWAEDAREGKGRSLLQEVEAHHSPFLPLL